MSSQSFRVYLTHSCVHENGFFQVLGASAQLHSAVRTATTNYLQDSTHAVPGSPDSVTLAEMLDRAWGMMAGRGPRVPVVTIVSADKRLVVEIFRS